MCVCRQALTEVSVLADMLHILHDHRHYMAMDTVAPRPTPSLPLAFQYIVKKKVHLHLCSVCMCISCFNGRDRVCKRVMSVCLSV